MGARRTRMRMLRNVRNFSWVKLALCSPIVIPALLWYRSLMFSVAGDHDEQRKQTRITQDSSQLDVGPAPSSLDWPKYSSPDMPSKPRLWLGLLSSDSMTPTTTMVFGTFNYKAVHQVSPPSRWDVYWGRHLTIHQMFRETPTFWNKLKPRQKVSNVPGHNQLTYKLIVVTRRDVSAIPPAFKIPKEKEQFFSYVKSHPEHLWLEKGFSHRDVRVVKPADVSLNADRLFVQQMIHNPFLVDGRKFNLGVFAGLTSSEPTRMYIYLGNFFLKFCLLPYYPFDPEQTGKYVDTGNYTLAKDLPSLTKMAYTDGKNAKACLTTYIQEQHGLPPATFDERIVDAITEVVVKREAKMSSKAQSFNITDHSHFFHFLRVDLLLDSNLRVWFIEANSGPNGGRDVPTLMEAMEDFLRVAGVSIPVSRDDIKKVVPDSEIEVDGPSCQTAECQDNCTHWECRVCSHCLTEDDRADLRRAVYEHRRQRAWRRVMPPPLKSPARAREWTPEKDPDFLNLSERTRFTALWYHRKCMQNAAFCN